MNRVSKVKVNMVNGRKWKEKRRKREEKEKKRTKERKRDTLPNSACAQWCICPIVHNETCAQ